MACMIFLTSYDTGVQHDSFPRKCFADTHLAFTRGISSVMSHTLGHFDYRNVAQVVARTAGGGEAAGSSPVIPTKHWNIYETTSSSTSYREK